MPPSLVRLSHREDRGVALTAHIAVVMLALLLMVGLVVDGGAQSAANRHCAQVAAEAARASSDAGALSRASGSGLDPGAMVAAGEAVITGEGLTGSVRIDGDLVSVAVSTTTETVFLSLIGVGTLPASAEARAELKASTGR